MLGLLKAMTKIENEKRTAETIRLYEVEQLSMKQIADRLNITRQAVLYRLSKAGVKFRPKRHDVRATISGDALIRLYVNERLSVAAVARQLEVDPTVVVREMERFSIERRPKYIEKRKPTPLDSLKVGDSAVIVWERTKTQYNPIHKKASIRQMKIKVKRVDANHVRVTRRK